MVVSRMWPQPSSSWCITSKAERDVYKMEWFVCLRDLTFFFFFFIFLWRVFWALVWSFLFLFCFSTAWELCVLWNAICVPSIWIYSRGYMRIPGVYERMLWCYLGVYGWVQFGILVFSFFFFFVNVCWFLGIQFLLRPKTQRKHTELIINIGDEENLNRILCK